jgi:hypothetical protein
MAHNVSKISLPNVGELNYELSVDKENRPILNIDQKRFFTGNPKTNGIISDGPWAYEIKPPADRGGCAAIVRENSNGATNFSMA